MKTIGLIGGMSWESTQEYYRIINEEINKCLGGLHSAKIILYSVDFAEIEKSQHMNDWNKLTKNMIDAAKSLEKAGADFIVICTNTMHKMADDIERSTNIPLLHLGDATAKEIKKKNLNKVGLLGTKFTMEEGFYKKRLTDKSYAEVLIPDSDDREIVHKVIFKELCLGKVEQKSKENYIRIIDKLIKNGAEGIVLGCTEIPLLIKQNDISVPIFDTTTIHAKAAVDFSLNG